MMAESFPGEYDVCNICEQVFLRPTSPPCEHCNHVHRDDEWCFQRVRHSGTPFGPLYTTGTARGFAAYVHEAIFEFSMGEGLGGRWAWTLDPKMSIVVGIRPAAEQGYLRFWVRDTERCNVVVDRPPLIERLMPFTHVALALEMIDPPALH